MLEAVVEVEDVCGGGVGDDDGENLAAGGALAWPEEGLV
jgi:hypothetical protein